MKQILSLVFPCVHFERCHSTCDTFVDDDETQRFAGTEFPVAPFDIFSLLRRCLTLVIWYYFFPSFRPPNASFVRYVLRDCICASPSSCTHSCSYKKWVDFTTKSSKTKYLSAQHTRREILEWQRSVLRHCTGSRRAVCRLLVHCRTYTIAQSDGISSLSFCAARFDIVPFNQSLSRQPTGDFTIGTAIYGTIGIECVLTATQCRTMYL